MNQVPEALRAYFQRHNRRVVGIAFLMLGFALLLWGLVYFFLYWVVLLMLTSELGTAANAPGGGFFLVFFALAAGLCAISYIDQKLWPFRRLDDHRNPLGTIMEVILSLTKMTLSAGQTLAAYHSPDEHELMAAWEVLGQLSQAGPTPIQKLPVELGGEKGQQRVLMALQWSGLVELQAGEDGLTLRLANEEAKRLAQAYVRIRL